MQCKFFIVHSCPGDKILEIESPGQSTQQSVLSSILSIHATRFASLDWVLLVIINPQQQAWLASFPPSLSLALWSWSSTLFVCVWQTELLSNMTQWMIYLWTVEFMGQIHWFIISLLPLSSISTLCVSGSNILVTQGWLMHWKGDGREWSSLFDIPLPFFSTFLSIPLLYQSRRLKGMKKNKEICGAAQGDDTLSLSSTGLLGFHSTSSAE